MKFLFRNSQSETEISLEASGTGQKTRRDKKAYPKLIAVGKSKGMRFAIRLLCGAEAGANQAKCNAMELCCLHLPEALGK